MAKAFSVKPTQKAVKTYYEALAQYAEHNVEHETGLRSAFQNLLDETGRRFGWTLIPELSDTRDGHRIQPDGTFRDDFHISRGFWEAKDTHDNLEVEIQKKIERNYPLSNTIFEDTRTAYLYQNGRQAMKADLADGAHLCDLLNAFFRHNLFLQSLAIHLKPSEHRPTTVYECLLFKQSLRNLDIAD